MDWKLSPGSMIEMGGGWSLAPAILTAIEPTAAIGPDIVPGAVFESFGVARHRRSTVPGPSFMSGGVTLAPATI